MRDIEPLVVIEGPKEKDNDGEGEADREPESDDNPEVVNMDDMDVVTETELEGILDKVPTSLVEGKKEVVNKAVGLKLVEVDTEGVTLNVPEVECVPLTDAVSDTVPVTDNVPLTVGETSTDDDVDGELLKVNVIQLEEDIDGVILGELDIECDTE